MSTHEIFWSTHDWAAAIACLPVVGLLPCRSVLVPRERVAHALRRELIRAGHPAALAGTRFLTPGGAAAEVLHAAGAAIRSGEEALRRARIAALFRQGLPLSHFPLALLRDRPGWDDAFARAIGDLEGAGLRPEDLDAAAAGLDAGAERAAQESRGADAARLRDVATVWRAVDETAGVSWTTQRILLEAAQILEREPARWPFPGPTLAPATGHATGAEAHFLRAIPGATLGILAARPARAHHLERMTALFGREVAEALAAASAPGASAPRASASERDLLARYLFEPPAALADPARPRSAGPDGTVDLEEHAGVEEEIEAAAAWGARQVLDGVPLEEIAVLVPALDPLAGLVAERLARLPGPGGPLPVHVAGGLPLTHRAAGARALAVVRALRAHLAGESLAAVLPALRLASPEGRHLSHGAAVDLVWSLGTAGGNAAHPEGALEWAARATRREADLAAQLERARAAADDPERAGLARSARELERVLGDLRAARPALEALTGVARLVVTGASLGEIWPALRDFLGE